MVPSVMMKVFNVYYGAKILLNYFLPFSIIKCLLNAKAKSKCEVVARTVIRSVSDTGIFFLRLALI